MMKKKALEEELEDLEGKLQRAEKLLSGELLHLDSMQTACMRHFSQCSARLYARCMAHKSILPCQFVRILHILPLSLSVQILLQYQLLASHGMYAYC